MGNPPRNPHQNLWRFKFHGRASLHRMNGEETAFLTSNRANLRESLRLIFQVWIDCQSTPQPSYQLMAFQVSWSGLFASNERRRNCFFDIESRESSRICANGF